MRLPLRLANSGQGSLAPGLIMAVAVATAVFSATPLVLPAVIQEYDLDISLAGLVSGAQLGGFVITSFLAGRIARPSSALFVFAVAVLATSNIVTALAPGFALFVATRFVAGLGLGVLTWLGWSSVFGQPAQMGRIAIIGPVAGVVASPLIGLILNATSFRFVFVGLATLALLPLLRIPKFDTEPTIAQDRSTARGAPVAYALIAGLGLITMGGSAVFVYSGLIALENQGLSALGFSLVLAANAAAGIPSARWSGVRRWSGVWFLFTGLAAVFFTTVDSPILGTIALICWGFSYWMGVPGAYQLLSERSRYPAERAGDAQAVMAIGRILGPLLGGALTATGSYLVLGLVGGGAMAAGGVVVLAIELQRTPVLQPHGR